MENLPSAYVPKPIAQRFVGIAFPVAGICALTFIVYYGMGWIRPAIPNAVGNIVFAVLSVILVLNHPQSWKKALPKAVELVRASGRKLYVMSVVPDMGAPLVEEFFSDDFEKKATAAASTALNEIVTNEVLGDISVKQHLAFGKIHRKIAKIITEIDCGLAVMKSHKLDRVRACLVGSNADRVVRRSPVSVLVVRA